jgi:hypothetical protein
MRIERDNELTIYVSFQKCDNGRNIKAGWGDFYGVNSVDYGLQLSVNIFLSSEGIKEDVRCINGITARFSRS